MLNLSDIQSRVDRGAATPAAQAEADAAAERASAAKQASDAALAAAEARKAEAQAAFNEQTAAAILAQKEAVATSLKTQLDA